MERIDDCKISKSVINEKRYIKLGKLECLIIENAPDLKDSGCQGHERK
jgi:hypothetical protein